MKTLTLTRPDDFHVHFRDEEFLRTTVPATAQQFGRAIAMPNLLPPITTLEALRNYKERILSQVPAGKHFTPLMTLYLTSNLSPQLIHEGAQEGSLTACKFYPAGATTHSEFGLQNLFEIENVLSAMAEEGIPLLLHGEVTTKEVDIFDREVYFLETVLKPLLLEFPTLKIVMEHITTKEAVDFIKETSHPLAATITPHHLLLNRNDLLVGGLHSHHYCLPILKRRIHQEALIEAAISGNPKFFLGTDSAPHALSKKESSCGCAGIYSAPFAMELYAELFDAQGALPQLENFASGFGADFYGLPRNQEHITLKQEPWCVPPTLPFGKETVVPFWAGRTLNWRFVHE